MSFHLDTDQIPSLPDYIQALSKWQSTKPWRGHKDENIRPLDKRSKKHVTIRKVGDDVVCRLYSTDLVRYKPDGTILVDVHYGSQSTEAFLQALFRRSGIFFSLSRGEPIMWRHDPVSRMWGNGQAIDGNTAVLDENRTLVNSKPIKERRLNVKAANKIRKECGYDEFVAWRKAYEAMSGDSQREEPRYGWQRAVRTKLNHLSPEEVTELLRARGESWLELTKHCDNEHIAQMLYRAHPEVVEVSILDHLENTGQHSNILALDRKYGWRV